MRVFLCRNPPQTKPVSLTELASKLLVLAKRRVPSVVPDAIHRVPPVSEGVGPVAGAALPDELATAGPAAAVESSPRVEAVAAPTEAVAPKEAATEEAAAAAVTPAAIDTGVFDPSEIIRACGGAPLLRRLLRNFDAPARMRDVDEARAAEAATKLSRASHSIKGQLAYLHAHGAVAAARALQVEAMAAVGLEGAWDGPRSTRVDALVAELRDHMASVDANRRAVLVVRRVVTRTETASCRTFFREV